MREAFRSPRAAHQVEICKLVDYLSRSQWHRFPGDLDPRFRLRIELEFALDEEVVLDVTELVSGGYYSHLDPMSKYAFDDLPAYERERCHIIILTEGSTDKFYLETAFNLFHQELREYVSFLDFNGWNVQWWCPFLGEHGSPHSRRRGIKDRIVAVFDNDTAGFASHARLATLKLPNNIRAIRYPDIDLAKSYPTLGPSGAAIMDVNGSAASIELYLGENVVRDPKW